MTIALFFPGELGSHLSFGGENQIKGEEGNSCQKPKEVVAHDHLMLDGKEVRDLVGGKALVRLSWNQLWKGRI